MSDPLFVPPIRYSLIKAVGSRQLEPLDLVIYQYLLAHSDSWVIREADICEQFNVSRAGYHRARARLVAAGLMAPGKGHRDRSRARPPKLIRLGQYRADAPNQVSASGLTGETTTEETNGRAEIPSGLTGETHTEGGRSSVSSVTALASPSKATVHQVSRVRPVTTPRSPTAIASTPQAPVFKCWYCSRPVDENITVLLNHAYDEHRDVYEDMEASLKGRPRRAA